MRQQTLCDVSHYVRKNFSAKLDFLYTDLFVNDQKKRNVACLADNFFLCFFSYFSLRERYSWLGKSPSPGGEGVLPYERPVGMGCAAGWGRIFTTGLNMMGPHF